MSFNRIFDYSFFQTAKSEVDDEDNEDDDDDNDAINTVNTVSTYATSSAVKTPVYSAPAHIKAAYPKY